MRRRYRVLGIVLFSLTFVVSLVGLWVSVASVRFARATDGAARTLWAASRTGAPLAADLAVLPAPVRRYVNAAGVLGRAPIRAARLRHGGTMTLELGAAPKRVEGVQYLASDVPGFVWWGRVPLLPGLWMDARDSVMAARGRMTVKALSLITIADVSDERLTTSALGRLLGELTWMPTALLDKRYVVWEAIDEASARAHLTVAGTRVSATFRFGADGLPESFLCDRFRDVGGGQSVSTPFVGTYRDFRRVDGILVPFALEGAWVLDGEPYTFARFAVETIELDVTEPF